MLLLALWRHWIQI